jgi:hypothetical protein
MDDEMVRVCSTFRREMNIDFMLWNMKGINLSGDRLDDNIKMDLKEIWHEAAELVHLYWFTLVNTGMNILVPLKAEKFLDWLRDY